MLTPRGRTGPLCPLVGVHLRPCSPAGKRHGIRNLTAPVAGGDGNCARQAALFLSHSCATVHVIIRRDAPDTSMSRHLIYRIERNPRIVVWPSTQVTALTGTGRLRGVQPRRDGQPEVTERAVTGLFVFIGATRGTR
jgi:thioredoxin reductase